MSADRRPLLEQAAAAGSPESSDAGGIVAAEAAAVSLRSVTKRFPGNRGSEGVIAVDALDVRIADGEFFSLLGPSGCGKTTTLRMIAGFEFPTSGSIRIFGEEVGLEPPNRRPVNTVFQSYALFPHMTVAQNVAFGLEMQGVGSGEVARRVGEAIELVRLTGLDDRRPRQLSGGQQQRVALARALVNHPKVLLLDEPLGALDLKLRQAMQVELKQLQEHLGITFVYVTHDQEEALTMSDRIAVMDGGRLLQLDTPEGVYDRPRTRFVADFIGDTNLLDLEVAGRGQALLADGTPVRIESGRTDRDRLTIALRPEKLGLRAVGTPGDPELDTVVGSVVRVTFMGNATVYDVGVTTAGAPLHLQVRQGNAPGVDHFDVGERVEVRWSPTSVAVLED